MAVHAGGYGPIIVSDPKQKDVLYFHLEGPMVDDISVEEADVGDTDWHATPGDMTLVAGDKSQKPNATWKEFFTELLSTASCESLIGIHYISEEQHKMAVAYLLKCGLLDEDIPYPEELYNE